MGFGVVEGMIICVEVVGRIVGIKALVIMWKKGR
jgi:hypothetical protein